MSSFSLVTPSMSSSNYTARLALTVDPYDYYNFTNQRPQSGLFSISVSSISWSGNSLSGQTIRADGRSPNYDSECDVPIVDNQLVSDMSSTGSATLAHSTYYVAWNAGVPGPSTAVLSDGLVELLEFNFALDPASTATGVTVTVSGTITFTAQDFYSGFTAGANPTPGQTVTLAVDRWSDKDWFNVLALASEFSGHNAAYVQLVRYDQTRTGGTTDDVPVFVAANVPDAGDTITLANHALTPLSVCGRKYPGAGMVFAINSGKIDGNATKNRYTTSATSSETARYNLGVFSLVKSGSMDATHSATIGFTVGSI